MDLIIKKLVKNIPSNNNIQFSNYNRKDYFKLISNIILDIEENEKKYIN